MNPESLNKRDSERDNKINSENSSDLNIKNAQKSEWYQHHLNRVSRSFAFGISELEEPLREYVGFAYLFCRLIDTIEDSDWPQASPRQQMQFSELIGFLNQRPSPEVFDSWLSQIPKGLPEGEASLLADSYQLIRDYHHLPEPVRTLLRGSFLTMIQGMAAFVSLRSSADGKIVLRNMLELNHYCFFVAGVVGEILTGLAHYHDSLNKPNNLGNSLSNSLSNNLSDNLSDSLYNKPPNEILLQSFHFGLFLQKINILKDTAEDARRGLFFFKERGAVVASLHKHAVTAKNYLQAMPESWTNYRLFCAFSVSLGLISLPVILNPMDSSLKISREHTKMLMSHLKEINIDPPELFAFIQSLIDQIPTELDVDSSDIFVSGSDKATMSSRFDPGILYDGQLSNDSVRNFFSSGE